MINSYTPFMPLGQDVIPRTVSAPPICSSSRNPLDADFSDTDSSSSLNLSDTDSLLSCRSIDSTSSSCSSRSTDSSYSSYSSRSTDGSSYSSSQKKLVK